MKRLPKVSRRRIGSKPRQNIWRQMVKQAAREIREEEDKAFLEFVREHTDKMYKATALPEKLLKYEVFA